MKKRLGHLLWLVLTVQLSGCTLAYYGQAAIGHWRLSSGSQPVAELLTRPDLDPQLRERLELSQAVLTFAHAELRLPDNGSYRDYADTGRAAAVWNVVATPEFSLEPLTWCFPIAGCVAYRGYFSASTAESFAARLAARGNDVYVGPVTAYSTLGRLRDPVLNTMLALPERAFVGLLVHELAHQRVYVQDDSRFNESFASAVEEIGLQRWYAQTSGSSAPQVARQGDAAAVRALLFDYRDQLAQLYASELPAARIRAQKTTLLNALELDYRALVGSAETPAFATFMAGGVNNAKLAALATYVDWVPAFRQIYAACGQALTCFYVRVEQLAELPAATRAAALAELLQQARPATTARTLLTTPQAESQ